MDLRNLRELIEFMEAYGLCEVEIKEEGKRIHLTRTEPDAPVVIKESGTYKTIPLSRVAASGHCKSSSIIDDGVLPFS